MSSTTSIASKLDNKFELPGYVKEIISKTLEYVGIPLVGILVFLLVWAAAAERIDTSLGQLPGPTAVWGQSGTLAEKQSAEREKETAFYERQEKCNADGVAKDPDYVPKIHAYTGKETFLDQIQTSLITVMITVILCCLWPMVINTAFGVSTIPKDLVNVSKVLRLPALTQVKKIVLPTSIPMIFTGMRLSLGIAWMVLIAAEMLAQNPGLGKFVWDEFQNGSSNSLSRIMAAVLVIGFIGFIGFLLDRGMLQIQRFVSWNKASASR